MSCPSITIDRETIPVTPDPFHEYVLTTDQVAQGYGINPTTLRRHKTNHADELLEGKHWFTCVQNMNARVGEGYAKEQTLWTKRGVIRLGFFIRSERAKRFRDAAEDLILRTSQPASASPAGTGSKHLFEIDGLALPVVADLVHDYLMAEDVAVALFDTSGTTMRREKHHYPNWIFEGEHWITAHVPTLRGETRRKTAWTRQGLLTLASLRGGPRGALVHRAVSAFSLRSKRPRAEGEESVYEGDYLAADPGAGLGYRLNFPGGQLTVNDLRRLAEHNPAGLIDALAHDVFDGTDEGNIVALLGDLMNRPEPRRYMLAEDALVDAYKTVAALA